MAYHLKCLEVGGTDPSLVRGYESFNDNWTLKWLPDNQGFLKLLWIDNGRIDNIDFCRVPIFLYNQWDENRKFYTPEFIFKDYLIENFGRHLNDPEVVFMEPEKMRKYGIESKLDRIDLERGVVEVMGHAFCSSYQPNMGKALLLRDFAVFYLNNLLEKTRESSI